MPRPPRVLHRDEVPAEDLEAYDQIVDRQRHHANLTFDDDGRPELRPYHAGLAMAPQFGVLISELGRVGRMAGDRPNTYSHADREFVDQILCRDADFRGFLKGHILDGVSAGLRIEAIAAIRAGDESDLTEDEQFLATYVRQVVNGTVDDETWNRMEDRLGERGVVEYTIWIAFLHLIMRLFQAFGSPEPTDEEIDELIAGIRDGSIEVPDFRERIN